MLKEIRKKKDLITYTKYGVDLTSKRLSTRKNNSKKAQIVGNISS